MVGKQTIVFTCSAEAPGLKEIWLYTDISGVWKREITGTENKKGITDSPATVQFRKENVPEGRYSWNCEAITGSAHYFADKDFTFEVKRTAPQMSIVDCNEADDCDGWQPTSCPQTSTQLRSCSNAFDCEYSLSRSCEYVTPRPSTIENVIPEEDTQPEDQTPVIVGLLSVVAAGAVAVFGLKRKGLV